MVIENENFRNNTIENFKNSCEKRKLVMIGSIAEIEFMKWNFLKELKISCKDIYYTEGEENIKEKVCEMQNATEPRRVVVLIANDYPFLTQRLLREAGFESWYSTKLFMERYCFYNNTNVCYFYLKE